MPAHEVRLEHAEAVEQAALLIDGGGKFTVTKTGLVRKTFNLHRDEWAALRRKAFEEERSASEIVREMLRKYLGIAD